MTMASASVRRYNRYVAPLQEIDENFDLDPPDSFADNYIFMPVLVNKAMKKFFQDNKQFVRPFTIVNSKHDVNVKGKGSGGDKSLSQKGRGANTTTTIMASLTSTSLATSNKSNFNSSNPKPNAKSPVLKSHKKMKINVRKFVANVLMSPDNYGLPYEIVNFPSKDGTILRGFLIRQESDCGRIPTIIFFHGNAGNIGDNLPCVCALYEDVNCNIFIFDYRGYGFSEGIPTERGVYWDAQAAFDYVDKRPDLDSSKIVLHGQSLGGAIVVDLSVRSNFSNRIAAIIIENTFSSINALMRDYTSYWFLRPFRLILRCFHLKRKFPTMAKISWVRCPTLFIVGLKDQTIAPTHSARLYSSCFAQQKRVYMSAEGEHLNCFFIDENYTKEIQKFLKDILGTSGKNDKNNNSNSSQKLVLGKSKSTGCKCGGGGSHSHLRSHSHSCKCNNSTSSTAINNKK